MTAPLTPAAEAGAGVASTSFTEVRNFFGNGVWNCTLSEVEPTGWDGSGKYWRHFVGQGATAAEAREAAAAAARAEVL